MATSLQLDDRSRDGAQRNRPSCHPFLRSLQPLLHLYQATMPAVLSAVRTIAKFIRSIYKALLLAIGPEYDSTGARRRLEGRPQDHTVVWAFLAFMVLLILGSLAVKFPNPIMRACFTVISSCLVGLVSILIGYDFVKGKGLKASFTKAYYINHNRNRTIQAKLRKYASYHSLYHDLVHGTLLPNLLP